MLMDNVQAINNLQVFGDKKVWYGNTAPPTADLQDKMLWFEPSQYPQPWEYDGVSSPARWRSSPQFVEFLIPQQAISAGTGLNLRMDKSFLSSGTGLTPLPFIWIDQYNAYNRVNFTGTTVDTAANYYTTTLSVINTAGALTQIFTHSTQNLAANQITRFPGTSYIYVANPLGLTLTVARTGTAASYQYLGAISLNIKYVRSV